MPTKNRGKSAAIVNDQINLLNVNADVVLPSNSPLKIESVIPRRSKSINSRFLRSYSTFSFSYLNTLLNGSRHTNENQDLVVAPQPTQPINNKNASGFIENNNNKPLENGEVSTNENASKPLSAAANVSNGFWRIQRSIKEKEKFPDRINLDRRGLATLPLIVDEPNLRLLSLQHNLINSICVPATNLNISDKSECSSSSLVTSVELAKKSDQNKSTRAIASTCVNKQENDGRRALLRAQSIQKPLSTKSSSRTLSRNFSINSNGIARNRLTNKIVDPNHNAINQKNTSLSRQNSSTTTTSTTTSTVTACKNSLIPKSAFLHSKERYVLKKSNSFINNYSKHLGRLIQNRHNGIATKHTLGLGSSFSSDSTPDIQPPTDMLLIKNDPFNGFAQCLQNLVFLDLYDNQIERISCLDGLSSLTVLLLGKNRITDISGVISVKNTLRVLDLHGNKITSIAQKVCQLHELKSLNLAGNSLKQIQDDDFKDLKQLKELNIKRNRIKKINGFDDLQALERLWLCHNEIEKVNHMSCLRKAINLREITIENNPVSLAGDCISFLVSHLKKLTLFNQMQITEQVRRAAMEWRKNRELLDSSQSDVSSDMRREEIISNARTNWELLRTQQPQKISYCMQKSLNNNLIAQQMPISRISNECDVESNLTENVMIDRKMIRQKTQIIRKNLKKPLKMKRSLSQDNCSIVSTEFRLPPIQQSAGEIIVAPSVNSSASSIGVNIDSTSSHFNSDIEENGKKIEELPSIQQDCDTLTENNGKLINPSESDLNVDMTTAKVQSTHDIALENELNNHAVDVRVEQVKETGETASESTLNVSSNQIIEKIENVCDEETIKVSMENINISSTPLEKSNQKNNNKNTNRRSCQHSVLQRSQTAKAVHLISSLASSSSTTTTPKQTKQLDREREQGGDYLIEICGRYLNVYGSGAVKFIDRQWNAQKANDVHTLKFSYVNFNNVATIFGRIKNRFPNAEHFAFRETNIQFLGQLNVLAELQGLTSLHIDTDGNPICMKEWRSYAIFRLSHWGIKAINDIEITKDEIDSAQTIYSGLSDLVLWSLPESLIEPLLLRLHLEESCTSGEKITAKQWLMASDSSLRSVVGKEALQCKFPGNPMNTFNQETEYRLRGRQCLSNLMENTYNAVEKLQKLETMWPNMLLDLIKATLIDYAQIDMYLENLIADIDNNATGKQ